MTMFQQPTTRGPVAPPPDPRLALSADVPRTPPAANATLVARADVADSVASFSLRLDAPMAAYRPGQYVSLGAYDGGTLVQRAYSIVSLDPSRTVVELFIRRVANGALSPLLWRLPPGERVRVGPAKGLFFLDEADRRARIFVGTGTGLAPLLAMLAALAARDDRSPNVLIHGVSYRDEQGYADRIGGWVDAGLDLWYIPTVSRPDDPLNAGWQATTGRADAVLARVLDADPSLAGGVAYLCGNSNMIEAVSQVLVGGGMRPEDVRTEQFHAPAPRPT